MIARILSVGMVALCAMLPVRASAQNYQLTSAFSASPSTPLSVGDPVTLTITVTNNPGSSSGGSGQAQLFIPDVFSFSGASCVQSQAQAASAGTFEFDWTSIPDAGGQLAPGQSDHCDINLTLVSLPPGNVSATVSIPPTAFDPSPVNAAPYQFNINFPPPSFAQALMASVAGQNVTLSFAASNAVSCVGSSTPAVAGWNGATLCSSAAGCGSVTVPLTNLSAGGYSFTATCSNVVSATAASSTSATVASATATTDLAVQGTASPSVISPGQTFSMQFTVQNTGAQDAPGVKVDVTTPAQAQIVSSTCSLPTGSGVSTWNVGTLVAGASATCDVQAKAIVSAPSVAEILSVSFAGIDTNTANDNAVVPITIGPGVDLAVALTSTAQFQTGAQASLLITVTNAAGAANATGVVVTEYATKDIFGVAANTCGAATTGTFVWNIGNLAAGQSVSCTLSGSVIATSAVTATASVVSQLQDTNLANNADTLVVQAFEPPVTESKTVSGAPTTGNSTHVALSGDSNNLMAVFESTDPNLITNNTNTTGQDIYSVKSSGAPVLETIGAGGQQLAGTSTLPAISDNGQLITFLHNSAPKSKLGKAAIIGNMWAGTAGQPKHQVDLGMGGAAPNGSASGAPSVSSSNGTNRMVFCSSASNLAAGDVNNANDVFLADPLGGAQTVLISTDASGKQLPGDSCEPKISADGTKVVFTVSARSLYGTDARQVVRKDLASGSVELISVSSTGAGIGANADSSEPTVSGDGSVVAFTSKASDLDGLGIPVGGSEAFVSLAQAPGIGTARLVKRVRSGDGTIPDGASQHPQISRDGTVVVMQSLASNFFGIGKSLAATACGSVAISTNFFNPVVLGSSLCGSAAANQNPAISGDGATTGFDSTAPQSGTNSNNSNAYSQDVGKGANEVPNLSGDFSGQWFDARQSGQGLVIDVLPPQPNNDRFLSMTWFVFVNGQPTWLQGAGIPKAGTQDLAGKVVVPMTMGIFQGKGFPIGETNAGVVQWGTATLIFADANTGTLTWTSTYPGFNSGSMAITHFQPVNLPAIDAAGAKIRSCFSGNWKEPAKSGHGFEFEITGGSSPVLVADWFTFAPNGAPVWLYGAGVFSGNSVATTLVIIDGAGAQFPPKFDASRITQHEWGKATFTFTDATHAHVAWNSSLPGYGSGQIDLVPLFGLDRRNCN